MAKAKTKKKSLDTLMEKGVPVNVMTTEAFQEEEMRVARNDLEKIRFSARMYISRVGSEGAIHLCKEAINNSIDECININSPADTVVMELNEDTNRFTCEDNGRGIPFKNLFDACTKIQSSTKFNRLSGQKSAGLNGAGLKIQNALSKHFLLEVWKLGQYAKVEFENNKEIHNGSVETCKDKKKHGTRVSFIPDEKYLGKCPMKKELLIEWLTDIAYLLPEKVELHLTVITNGKKTKHKFVRPKNGFSDIIYTIEKNYSSPIFKGFDTKYYSEEVTNILNNGETEKLTLNREIDIYFVFGLNAELLEPKTISFCNFVHTKGAGDHEKAMMDALCEYLSRKTRDVLTEKEKEKFSIMYNDITRSLVMGLNLNMSGEVGFDAQTKERIENKIIIKPIKETIKEQMDKFFADNPKELKKYTDVVKANAKARYESNKVRTKIISSETRTSNVAEHSIPNYFPANNKGKNDYRELFIYEGLSVKSNGTQARDPEYQAMYTMRGVPGELYSSDHADIEKNETFYWMAKAINAGVGPNCNPDKCKFGKIIITTDADIDGNFIFSLTGGFFLKHMRPVVEAGLLYMSVPPLYKIDDKKKPFVTDKGAYQEVYYRRVMDRYELRRKSGKPLTKKEYLSMLELNKNYVDELQRCSDHYSVSPLLMEFIVKYRDEKNFLRELKKQYPEITVEPDVDNKKDLIVEGIYEGKYQIFTMDELFDKKTSELKKLMDLNDEHYYTVGEIGKTNTTRLGNMSLGEFLTMTIKLMPGIKMRYKGLGELSEDDLWETTMNPASRTIVKLTLKDLEHAIQTYDTLHGKGKVNGEARKVLNSTFEINRDMLDN